MLRFLARNLFAVAVLLVATSEVLILQWALLAAGGAALGAGGTLLAVLGVTAANLGLMTWMRRARSTTRGLRGPFMMVSLGALLSGPLLLASLAAGLAGPQVAAVGGALALSIGFGSVFWGYSVGQRRVVVEDVPIPLRGLPEGLEGFTIAHITDLHIGPQLRAARLRGFIERVNEVGADMIAITGDMFDFDPEYVEEGCLELAALDAPFGVWAVLGNHDVYTGADTVADGLRKWTSIRLLRDEWTTLDVGGEPLHLLGIDDPGRLWGDPDASALRRVAAECPDVPARLLLVHRPNYFEAITELGLPIAIAGHTHGGQVALPPPMQHHNISRLMTQYTRGLFESEQSLMYVNRGLGVAGPPIRLNCPREIARLRLTRR
ncbi:MAG: metallophosphoesterase [Deltaproteobacteria bacterium]|nr:metallophosphoesterase [Deltaproteobacteria bacterium]MBW2412887.1 metallophosphoesterase [Deltaproteobacteria bacterium]